MKEKIVAIIGIIGFFIISALIFNTDAEFALFFMLVIALLSLYSIYKESVRREEEISKLKEEIRELKNK
jgi:membrane protein implicated in regulation of membrane protease activity